MNVNAAFRIQYDIAKSNYGVYRSIEEIPPALYGCKIAMVDVGKDPATESVVIKGAHGYYMKTLEKEGSKSEGGGGWANNFCIGLFDASVAAGIPCLSLREIMDDVEDHIHPAVKLNMLADIERHVYQNLGFKVY